jgi:hypothetical protein
VASLPLSKLLLIGVLLLIPILPNLLAIWHIFHSDFKTNGEKLGWLFAAMFAPVLGGILYWILGYRRSQRVL